jgi:acid phosphatase
MPRPLRFSPTAARPARCGLISLTAGLVSVTAPGAAFAAQPPSRVVIVIEENHGFEQVIGSPDAPFINALAAQGALFTNMFGLTHPSQPNYLELFSGTNQGVTDNLVPPGIPFSTPNLGAAVFAKGNTYASYSEGLPAIGSNVDIAGAYVRKHNPTPNWQSNPVGPNQLPLSSNRRFVDFPADFGQLPTVSIVVPDLDNDMHDGTIAQADAWLQTNLGPYVAWADANDAMLIITWDEDGFAQRNRIPTIFYGPMVRPGAYPACYTLHNLLRTVEDWHGVGHAGAAAIVRPMIGSLKADPLTVTASFCQGENGYAGASDTYVEAAAPAANRGSATVLVADGSPLSQILVKFDALFGAAAGQIPPNAVILSAKLRLLSTDSSANRMALHRMLIPWNASSTWNALVNGVTADDTEAMASPSFSPLPNTLDTWVIFDVTADIEAFASGAATNQGWAALPSGTDGWRVASCEQTLTSRPRLEVTYYVPECATFASSPEDSDACRGGMATFSCSATGNPPPALQWRRDGEPLPGRTGPTLTLTGIGPDDAGTYDCVASGACGDVPSSPAILRVCIADLNCDASVDLVDFFEFLNCFDQSLACADVDDAPGVDLGDFFAFFNAFDASC